VHPLPNSAASAGLAKAGNLPPIDADVTLIGAESSSLKIMEQFPDTMPLIKDRIGSARSVFVHGHRIRMNVVPMFLNVFVPWGVFILCCGLSSFWVMYAHPRIAWGLIGFMYALCVLMIAVAFWARRFEPDPTWFTYAALAVLVMAIGGTVAGQANFKNFSEPYFKIHDLKVIREIDASYTPGKNVMDGGIFMFGSGNGLDETRSWHFTFKHTYCVAPIITNTTAPLSQSYDFWAVGKDCCSTSSSDFRCGSWGLAGKGGGIRMLSGGDMKYYKLAVQQAESLYNINAPNPILLTWSSSPDLEVSSWNQQVFKNYMMMVAVALVASLFFMTLATCSYAFIGRSKSAYATDFYDEDNWQQGGVRKPMDYGVRSYGA